MATLILYGGHHDGTTLEYGSEPPQTLLFALPDFDFNYWEDPPDPCDRAYRMIRYRLHHKEITVSGVIGYYAAEEEPDQPVMPATDVQPATDTYARADSLSWLPPDFWGPNATWAHIYEPLVPPATTPEDHEVQGEHTYNESASADTSKPYFLDVIRSIDAALNYGAEDQAHSSPQTE